MVKIGAPRASGSVGTGAACAVLAATRLVR
jgi:hypothetical protein